MESAYQFQNIFTRFMCGRNCRYKMKLLRLTIREIANGIHIKDTHKKVLIWASYILLLANVSKKHSSIVLADYALPLPYESGAFVCCVYCACIP